MSLIRLGVNIVCRDIFFGPYYDWCDLCIGEGEGVGLGKKNQFKTVYWYRRPIA